MYDWLDAKSKLVKRFKATIKRMPESSRPQVLTRRRDRCINLRIRFADQRLLDGEGHSVSTALILLHNEEELWGVSAGSNSISAHHISLDRPRTAGNYLRGGNPQGRSPCRILPSTAMGSRSQGFTPASSIKTPVYVCYNLGL